MRLEVSNGRRLFVALCATLVLLACNVAVFAQRASHEPRARKIDEYVNQFSTCHAGVYLDNFAIELQNGPALNGYIVIYGPSGADDVYGQHAVSATKGYLVSMRGIDESRLRVVYGGLYKSMQEIVTELWLVPEGAALPRVSKYKPDLGFEGRFNELSTWDGPNDSDEGGWSDSDEVALVGLSDLLRRRRQALGGVEGRVEEERNRRRKAHRHGCPAA